MEFHLYVIEVLLFAGKQRTIIQHYENTMKPNIYFWTKVYNVLRLECKRNSDFQDDS